MAASGAGEVRVAVVAKFAFAYIAWSLVGGPATAMLALAQLAGHVVFTARYIVVASTLRAFWQILRDAPMEEKGSLLDSGNRLVHHLVDRPPLLHHKYHHWRLLVLHGVTYGVETLG